MRTLLVIAMFSFGCKQPSPPLKAGKCRVMAYRNGEAQTSECVYDGYLWLCTDGVCVRTSQVGGEAPIVSPAPPDGPR